MRKNNNRLNATEDIRLHTPRKKTPETTSKHMKWCHKNGIGTDRLA